MEKTMKTFLAALSALILLTGCRTAGELQEAPVCTVLFRAAASDTRTAFAEPVNGLYQTLWTRNDREVRVSLNYGKAVPAPVSVSADGKTATFNASFETTSATAPYTFYAVSPASAARAISPSRKAWSVSIAPDQTPLASSVDESAQLLVGKFAGMPEEIQNT